MPAILFVNLRRTAAEGRAAIVAARRLNYDIALLADKVPDYARELLDQDAVELVDTYDLDQGMAGARRLADRFRVAGVVTWADRDVELVAHIGQSLGLPAPSPAAARRARNKFAMRQAFAQHPRLVPRHALVRSQIELQAAADTIGFPSVLKPTGASGSKGIFELHGPADLDPAFAALQLTADPGRDPVFRHYGAEFIFEEFLAGPEFSVEGWVHDGAVVVTGVTDKWTTAPFHLEYQHIYPSCRPESELREIVAGTAQVINVLGLDHTAFHLEGKLTPRGFRLVEVAARIGGDYITSHLVPLSSGLDFYSQVVRVAVGQQPIAETSQCLRAGARFLLAEREGVLKGLDGIDRIHGRSDVEHVFVETPPGAEIALPPRNFSSMRVAAVIARHPDYMGVVDALQQVADSCRVVVEAAVAA